MQKAGAMAPALTCICDGGGGRPNNPAQIAAPLAMHNDTPRCVIGE
jgi:hypothetical protein